MVYWITGKARSGKTVLAYKLKKQILNSVVLDGEDFRGEFKNSDFSYEGRKKNILLIVKIAKILEKQGNVVIIACVSPNKKLRKKAQAQFKKCLEIYLPYGEEMWGIEHED